MGALEETEESSGEVQAGSFIGCKGGVGRGSQGIQGEPGHPGGGLAVGCIELLSEILAVVLLHLGEDSTSMVHHEADPGMSCACIACCHGMVLSCTLGDL